MPMKEWIYRLQPVQLYIVLVLSIVYFLVQLFLSHISHALVLLVDSYHMLCNIIALSGCILTIKHSKKSPPASSEACRPHRSVSQNSLADGSEDHRFMEVPVPAVGVLEAPAGVGKDVDLSPAVVKAGVKVKGQQQRENSLRNTFGWARIDVLTMLVVCIFLASFCFSAVVEALQTLSHIHHQDAMHFPIPVLILGALGIVLNGFCYLLIGGYTYHQGSFLYITSSGNVVLDRVVSGDGIRKGERRLSGSRKHVAGMNYDVPKRQSVREMMRDVCSTVFVIICSMIVHYTNEDEDTSKFVDPLCSILSCVVLMTLSYPYMKESGMILLQTIPDTIDIEIFERTMLKTFPDIVSVHDLHIWQLSSNKYVSTAHVIFENPKVYSVINDQLIDFFHDMGINQVTIQPEFASKQPVLPLLAAPPHSKKSPPASSEACRPHRSVSQNSLADGSEDHRFMEVPVPAVGVLEAPAGVGKDVDLSPAVVKAGVKVKGQQQRENSLRNTFGWARIDVLTMLVVCIFLASFCFSAVVEALQTLSHIHHQDAMHFPIPVLILGALGIVLNGFCYLLIGGYTYHQGSFLYITSSGNVVLDRVVSGDGIRKGERRLSGSRKHVAGMNYDVPKRQSVREMMRDVCSTVFVIICSMIVHYTNEDEDTSKFVDPLCSILSCVVLMTLSYPYMKESGMILLQTIPDTIDIEIFERTMLKTFPDIVSVHDLHIWQLSSNKYVSTAHVIFENPKVYSVINDQLIDFFHDMGINQVTIQPEFASKQPVLPLLAAPPVSATSAQDTAAVKDTCLMQCRGAGCLDRHCCNRIVDKDQAKKSDQLTAVVTSGHSSCHGHSHSHPEGSEQIPMEVQKPAPDVPPTDSVLKESKEEESSPAEIHVTSSSCATTSECGHTH